METFVRFHGNFNLHTLVVRIIFFMVVCYTLSSGNRTPGSRFYPADLLDTLADSLCIHLLVLVQSATVICKSLVSKSAVVI